MREAFFCTATVVVFLAGCAGFFVSVVDGNGGAAFWSATSAIQAVITLFLLVRQEGAGISREDG